MWGGRRPRAPRPPRRRAEWSSLHFSFKMTRYGTHDTHRPGREYWAHASHRARTRIAVCGVWGAESGETAHTHRGGYARAGRSDLSLSSVICALRCSEVRADRSVD